MSRNVVPVSGVATSPAYSHVVRMGDQLVVAGQVSQDAEGRVVGKGDITAQTRQAFENLRAVLASAGASFDDVAKLTVYVTDPGVRAEVSEVRNELFAEPRPASTYLVIAGLAHPDFLVEIEAIAWLGS
ncbi:MAG: RidA family protein [Acidimicrobiia bacterium]|nr:RidA family protein [Acidimicrobiia bacterium]